jgi:hypothetical protein
MSLPPNRLTESPWGVLEKMHSHWSSQSRTIPRWLMRGYLLKSLWLKIQQLACTNAQCYDHLPQNYSLIRFIVTAIAVTVLTNVKRLQQPNNVLATWLDMWLMRIDFAKMILCQFYSVSVFVRFFPSINFLFYPSAIGSMWKCISINRLLIDKKNNKQQTTAGATAVDNHDWQAIT